MPEEPKQLPAIKDQILNDLAGLIDGAAVLDKIVAESAIQKPVQGVFALSARVAKRLQMERSVVYDVLFGLLNINRSKRKLDGKGIVSLLTESLERDAPDEWKDDYLKKWLAMRGQVESAIDTISNDHPMLISQKAERLAYLHENLLIHAHVVTDIRPVFDSAGDKILESIVMHSLMVHYSTGSHQQEHRNISFSLDNIDIDDLYQACARAKRKAAAIRQHASNLNPISPDA